MIGASFISFINVKRFQIHFFRRECSSTKFTFGFWDEKIRGLHMVVGKIWIESGLTGRVHSLY